MELFAYYVTLMLKSNQARLLFELPLCEKDEELLENFIAKNENKYIREFLFPLRVMRTDTLRAVAELLQD